MKTKTPAPGRRRPTVPRPPAKQPIIVVLGMHRSGTSVIARGLEALGVSLGDNLMKPVAGYNEKGFFEDMDVYRLNERLLGKMGSTWHTLTPLEADALRGPRFTAERQEAANILRTKLGVMPFAFKDPRTAVLLPLWQCVFEDLGLDDRYVIAVRNPLESAASLEARDGMAPAKAMLLWSKHLLDALQHSQGRQRVFVSFDRILSAPGEQLGRLAAGLGLAAPTAEQLNQYSEDFLTSSLRHNHIGASELRRSGQAAFAIDLYDLLDRCTRSDREDIEPQELDAIRSRFAEISPFLKYADQVESERHALKLDLEAATKRTSELQSSVQRASDELITAKHAVEIERAAAERAAAEVAKQQAAAADGAAALKTALERQRATEHALEAANRNDEQLADQVLRLETESRELKHAVDTERIAAAESAAALKAAIERQETAERELDSVSRSSQELVERGSRLEAQNSSLERELEKSALELQGIVLRAAADLIEAKNAFEAERTAAAKADAVTNALLTAAVDDAAAVQTLLEQQDHTERAWETAAQRTNRLLGLETEGSVERKAAAATTARLATKLVQLVEERQQAAIQVEALAARNHQLTEAIEIAVQRALSAVQEGEQRQQARTANEGAAADRGEALADLHATEKMHAFVSALEDARNLGESLSSQIAIITQRSEAAALEIAQYRVQEESLRAALTEERQRTASAEARALEAAEIAARADKPASVEETLSAQLKEASDSSVYAHTAIAAELRDFAQALADSRKELEAAAASTQQAIEVGHERAQTIEELRINLGSRNRTIAELKRDLQLTRGALTAVRRSTSWRITAPFRAIAMFARNPVTVGRSVISVSARAVWRALTPTNARTRIANALFKTVPWMFSRSGTYKRWQSAQLRSSTDAVNHPIEVESADPTLEGYVSLTANTPPQGVEARAIAFYLPQFHPIPENDQWWGAGFTEWTKVRPAKPCFDDHYQPHEPDELGYYDLLADEDMLRRQSELARLHGISGFCFYFYWFGGKRLLEAPIEKFLNDKTIDMPFCLCWANENWTRRWDGKSNEILLAQNHSPQDDIAFITHLSRYLEDSRYIRVDGRPLIVVYRPALLPSAKETAARWRQWLRQNGFGEVYLAYTQSFESVPPEAYGFDAAIEFPPNNMGLMKEPAPSSLRPEASAVSVYDWQKLSKISTHYGDPGYKLFRGVTPSWDNTPRRPRDGTVFVNTSPSAYTAWLSRAAQDTTKRFKDPDERLIFINAWNEWAEGAHLEPDRKHGYAWLEATRRSLSIEQTKRKVIVVTHDLHRHGAQYLSLNLVRSLRKTFGFEVATISGGPGALAAEFESESSLHTLDPKTIPEAEINAAVGALARDGFRQALVNSAASAWIVPYLAKHGIRMVGLVHELPSIISAMKLGPDLARLDQHAEAVIFPTASARAKDAPAAGLESWRNPRVLPQGLFKGHALNDLGWKHQCRERLASRLNLESSARFILCIGYGDSRKGIDLFIDWAVAAVRRWPHLHFVWVGEIAIEMRSTVDRRMNAAGPLRAHIHFIGFADDTSEYNAAADFYALSSREDPFPSTALDALAHGTPVITVSGCGGIEELSPHGCVSVLPDATPASFLSAAAGWIEDENALHSASLRGRDLIRERFGFTSYVARLTDELQLNVPSVSIVVPNFNYAQYLKQRLDSILAQTLPPREILFLDDASTDESIMVAERALQGSGINWRVVRNERNSGNVFAQWRKGAELVSSDLVWIAEADDWADSRFLETAAKAFQRSDVVLSMTQSQQANGDGAITARDYLDYLTDISPTKWLSSFVGDGSAEVRAGLAVKNTIPNVSAVLFKRSVLVDVLRQHERDISSYRVAGDWCVYVNMLRHGSLAFAPEALNIHRRHSQGVTIAKFGLQDLAEIARMQAYVAREFEPGPEAARRARAYLEQLVQQFGLDKRCPPAQIEGAMRGVVAA